MLTVSIHEHDMSIYLCLLDMNNKAFLRVCGLRLLAVQGWKLLKCPVLMYVRETIRKPRNLTTISFLKS